jgi:hypothetical protein
MLKKIVLFSSIASVFFLFGCGKSLEKNVFGKWAYEMSIPVEEKEMAGQGTIKCVSEFFPNKSVNHNCEMKLSGVVKNGGPKIEMEAKVVAAGDWTLTDKTVYEKTIDGKIELTMLSVNGDAISDKEKLNEVQKDMDSPFVKGETTKYVTISNDGKTWVFETEVEKKKVTVTATKQ